jgi:tetratricopeptide (TPR) repeat protein
LPGEYFAEKSRTSLRDQERATPVYYALRGLATEQKNPNLFYNLGSGLAAEANATEELQKRFSLLQAALLAFQSAHDVAPQDRDYLIALGAVYDALERFPEAEWMYDEAIRLDPKFVPTREAYQQHLEKWRHAGGPKQPQDADPNPK